MNIVANQTMLMQLELHLPVKFIIKKFFRKNDDLYVIFCGVLTLRQLKRINIGENY